MWAYENSEKLRSLWLGGVDIGTIARELGTSKKAAYSKVQRMKLPVRHEKKKWNRCRPEALQAQENKGEKGK